MYNTNTLISQQVYAACTRSQLNRRLLRESDHREAGQCVLRNHSIRSVRRPFPPRLELLRVCAPCPQHSCPSRPPMDVVSATSAIVGLAVPVFQSAKALRDRIKLVRYPPHPLCTLTALIIILYPRSQVASEQSELLAALTEYEPHPTSHPRHPLARAAAQSARTSWESPAREPRHVGLRRLASQAACQRDEGRPSYNDQGV